MADASSWSNEGKICARCRNEKCREITKSPVEGAWVVYQCEKCLYTWRNTETEGYTNPDKYPEKLRMKQSDLDNLFVMPSIPPLRKST